MEHRPRGELAGDEVREEAWVNIMGPVSKDRELEVDSQYKGKSLEILSRGVT